MPTYGPWVSFDHYYSLVNFNSGALVSNGTTYWSDATNYSGTFNYANFPITIEDARQMQRLTPAMKTNSHYTYPSFRRSDNYRYGTPGYPNAYDPTQPYYFYENVVGIGVAYDNRAPDPPRIVTRSNMLWNTGIINYGNGGNCRYLGVPPLDSTSLGTMGPVDRQAELDYLSATHQTASSYEFESGGITHLEGTERVVHSHGMIYLSRPASLGGVAADPDWPYGRTGFGYNRAAGTKGDSMHSVPTFNASPGMLGFQNIEHIGAGAAQYDLSTLTTSGGGATPVIETIRTPATSTVPNAVKYNMGGALDMAWEGWDTCQTYMMHAKNAVPMTNAPHLGSQESKIHVSDYLLIGIWAKVRLRVRTVISDPYEYSNLAGSANDPDRDFVPARYS
jgi:hypothetical protein